MAMIAIQRAIPNASYCQNSMTRPFHQRIIRPGDQTYRFTTAIERLLTPRTIYVSIWISKPVRPGPSTDLKDTPRRGTMVTRTIIQTKYQFRISSGHSNSQLHATSCPDTEGLLTPCASPKKYWTMNSHKVSNL